MVSNNIIVYHNNFWDNFHLVKLVMMTGLYYPAPCWVGLKAGGEFWSGVLLIWEILNAGPHNPILNFLYSI